MCREDYLVADQVTNWTRRVTRCSKMNKYWKNLIELPYNMPTLYLTGEDQNLVLLNVTGIKSKIIRNLALSLCKLTMSSNPDKCHFHMYTCLAYEIPET